MQIETFDALSAMLRDLGLDCEEPAPGLLELTIAGVPVCLRWDDRLPLVHIVVPIYAGAAAEVVEVLCRFNHELPLPGLGWDPASSHIYFRAVLARGREGVTFTALDGLLTLVLDCVRSVRPALDELFLPAMPAPAAEAHQALVDIGDYMAA